MSVFLPQDQGWMSVEELEALRALALSTFAVPGRVVELGVWKGLSTSALATALHFQEKVVCVDTFEGTKGEPCEGVNTYEQFRLNAFRLRFDRQVELHVQTTACALAELHRRGERVRFALVDADHSTEAVRADTIGVAKLLSPGGIVAFDDVTTITVADALEQLGLLRQLRLVGDKLGWVRRPA